MILLGCAVVLNACSADGMGGRLRAVDDTGLRPSPIEEGRIALLPTVEPTWDLLGARPRDSRVESNADVTEADVLAAGGAWEPLHAGGKFDLSVTPGEWAVCYVPAWGGGGPDGVVGCYVVELEEGSRIEASWGEGGFGASVR